MYRLLVVVLGVAALAGGAATPVAAQVFNTGPAGLAQQMPRVYAPYLANISRIKILEKRSAGPSGGAPGRPPAAHPARETTFRPVGPPFVPRKLAATLGKTPQERQQLEATLTTCLDHYLEGARQKGVPLHDVARALNYYLSTSLVVFSEGRQKPTQAELDASRAAVHANLLADPAFQRMSEMQKQEAYETLIVLGGFVDLGYGTARQNGDAATEVRFREMAGKNLETVLGVPAQRLRFTSAGLAAR